MLGAETADEGTKKKGKVKREKGNSQKKRSKGAVRKSNGRNVGTATLSFGKVK